MKKSSECTLVISWETDVGPGPPHDLPMKTIYLYKSHQLYGKQFFITMDFNVSQTWVTDEQAEAFIFSAKNSLDK